MITKRSFYPNDRKLWSWSNFMRTLISSPKNRGSRNSDFEINIKVARNGTGGAIYGK